MEFIYLVIGLAIVIYFFSKKTTNKEDGNQYYEQLSSRVNGKSRKTEESSIKGYSVIGHFYLIDDKIRIEKNEGDAFFKTTMGKKFLQEHKVEIREIRSFDGCKSYDYEPWDDFLMSNAGQRYINAERFKREDN